LGSRYRGRRAEVSLAGRMSADAYGAADAGRLLGLSPRRIRQLADDGQLEAVGRSPLMVSAVSVLEMRSRRQGELQEAVAVAGGDMAAARDVAVSMNNAIERMDKMAERLAAAYETQLAITAKSEESLREALAIEKARADTLQARLDALEMAAKAEPIKAEKAEKSEKKRKKWKRGR